ncbi:MAG: hypothetical protein AAB676_21845, partial [Verrucomicrobiota bacterium]
MKRSFHNFAARPLLHMALGLVCVNSVAFVGLSQSINTSIVSWGYQTNVPASATNVIAIAGGVYHFLGLRADGSVIGWGDNGFGQISIPSGLTNATAIAAGYFHSLALRSDGTILAWGWNDHGQTNIPTGLTNVVAIAAGDYHCLALKKNGQVVGWGGNNDSQIEIPKGLTNVLAIAAGGAHSLALTIDGSVISWGANYFNPSDMPEGLTDIIDIAAGANHSLALRRDGVVVAWGSNETGQSDVPTGLTNVLAIAAGQSQSLALKGDGKVAAWGYINQNRTNILSALKDVVAISASYDNGLALTGSLSPFILKHPTSRAVSTGNLVILLTHVIGTLPLSYQWQFNGADIPAATNSAITLGDVDSAKAGSYQLVVGNSLGVVVSEVIDLQVIESPPFINAQPDSKATYPAGSAKFEIFAGGSKPLFYWWGFEGARIAGATNAILALDNVTKSQVGGYSVLISNAFGSVTSATASLSLVPLAAWGANWNGQTTVPPGLADVAAIAGGGGHSLALKSDGTVVAWGNNYYGQTNVPSDLTNVVSVAAGYWHSLALK